MIKKILPAIFLFIVSVAATPAQMNPEQAIINAREDFSSIKTRSMELERMKREAYKQPASDNFTPKFPVIKEDFEQIQKLNDKVFELTSSKNPINYAAVLKFVSEINHRSVHLKSNLFTSKSNEKKEPKNTQQIGATQPLKILLDTLDKSVTSFVQNSIFRNPNLVDSQDSLKAQKDLETLINISSAIKEEAKKLAKNDSKE